jgi:DNA-binding response OmpR family regulator
MHVLLVEPNAALRSAIVDVLASENFLVDRCESLEDVVGRARGRDGEVALVAWQSMQGLLAEEHHHSLSELTRRLRLVLMVPRRWARMLDETELGVAALVPKPFGADELLLSLRRAALRELAVTNAHQ